MPTNVDIPNLLPQIYRKAITTKPSFDDVLYRVGKRTGARTITNLKNPDTAVQKADRKNYEDPGRDYKLTNLNDVVRGRLVYNSLDAMRKGVDALKDEVKEQGIKAGKPMDYFNHPKGGYRGYHIDLTMPNGQVAEVQLHTLQSYAATMATHATHYEYGDKVPVDVESKKEAVNKQIQQLPNKDAAKVAAIAEQENAPANARAQLKALKTAVFAGNDIPNISPGRFSVNQGTQQISPMIRSSLNPEPKIPDQSWFTINRGTQRVG